MECTVAKPIPHDSMIDRITNEELLTDSDETPDSFLCAAITRRCQETKMARQRRWGFHLSIVTVVFFLVSSTYGNVNKESHTMGRFLWFSDLHLDLFYGSSQAMNWHEAGCNVESALDDYPFGKVKCDSPTSLVNASISKARQVLPDPNFILLTGDLCRHGNEKFSGR